MRFLYRKLNEFKIRHNEIISGQETDCAVSNPLHAFFLIKRLVNDWESIKRELSKLMFHIYFYINIFSNQNFETCTEIETKKSKSIQPTEMDLRGIADSIFRLQDVYKLNTTDIANGYLRKTLVTG